MRRPHLTPSLAGTTDLTLEEVLEHIRLWRADTVDTIEVLRADRREVDSKQNQLESPKAVREYIDFFDAQFTRLVAELDRLLEQLPGVLRRSHVDELRRLASHAAVERRRCLEFRDKWINRPLPFEQLRPLLNRILSATRDQLVDYRDMTTAATRLAALAGGEPAAAQNVIGRRELFSRLLGGNRDDGT